MADRKSLSATPVAAERAISDRLLALAADKVSHIPMSRERDDARSEAVQRLRRELAYRRFLARVFHAQPDSWVLKGGVGLMFRLDPNRPSYDIDIAHIGAGVDHAIALRQLNAAVRTDLCDWFNFELGSPQSLTDEAGAVTVGVIARIGAKEFARFSVDMPQPREQLANQHFAIAPLGLGIDAIDSMPEIRLLPLELQLADKICAMFERHGVNGELFSSRSRDLADIAMIAMQQPVDGGELHAALAAEAQRRAGARLVNGLPATFLLMDAQVDQWRATWTKSARKAPVSFDEAVAIADRFLTPVLAGDVEQVHWSPVTGAWG